MRFLWPAIVLVACSDSGNTAPAREKRTANLCSDAPHIANSEIVYCEGLSPDAITGRPLLVTVSTCCVYAIANGNVTPIVTHELIADQVVAGGWLYVATGEQTEHPAAIARVALDGSKRETLLALETGDRPLGVAVAGAYVYAVTAHHDPKTQDITELRLHRIPSAGGKAGSTRLNTRFTALAVRGDRALLAAGAELYEIRDLALSRLATAQDNIVGVATSGSEVYVATNVGVYHLTSRSTFDLVATGKAVHAVAASPTHVAWTDGYQIMAQPIASPASPKQVATFREEPNALAIDASAVYWSVAYYFAADAKTVDERLRSQHGGFVARTSLR